MILSDSHCHLHMTPEPDAQIARALAAGVARFLVPGTTLADSEAAAVGEDGRPVLVDVPAEVPSGSIVK